MDIYRWAAHHQRWKADNLLVLLGLSLVYLALFVWRKWVMATAEIMRLEALQRELERRVTHDALTGLSNRILFMDRLKHAIERALREQAMIAVVFVDLDGFKAVNDRLGHVAGDELLVQVANRLERCIRSADTVSRLSGDEFGVLLEDVEDARQVRQVAARIIEEVSVPFALEGGEASVSASIGVALDGLVGHEAEELLRQADLAMYRAKKKGGARYEISGDR